MQQGQALADQDGRKAEGDDSAVLIAALTRYRRARERRPPLFRHRGLHDPAWDMMLFILAAGIEGRRVSISAVASAGLVPLSTGLRWIIRLIGAELVYREGDLRDARRMNLRLTERGEVLARKAADDLVLLP